MMNIYRKISKFRHRKSEPSVSLLTYETDFKVLSKCKPNIVFNYNHFFQCDFNWFLYFCPHTLST